MAIEIDKKSSVSRQTGVNSISSSILAGQNYELNVDVTRKDPTEKDYHTRAADVKEISQISRPSGSYTPPTPQNIHWQAPVLNVAALPTVGNLINDARIVENGGTPLIYICVATNGTISQQWELYNPTSGSDHEALSNLMGGQLGQHYHLNASDYNDRTTKTYVDSLVSGVSGNSALIETVSGALVSYTNQATASSLIEANTYTNQATGSVYNQIHSELGQPNNFAKLDSNGLLEASELPPISITDVFVVQTIADMLALDAQTGDVAIVVAVSANYILATAPASAFNNWKMLLVPTPPVLSVNNKTGNISLTTSDIPEGSNLYFTVAAVRNSITGSAPIVFNQSTGEISITQSGSATNGYLSTQDWNTFNNKQDYLGAGILSTPSYHDNNNGSITIGAGDYALYSNANGSGTIRKHTIPGLTLTPLDNQTSYVVVDYNGGNPSIYVASDVNIINETTIIPLYTFFRYGTRLHKMVWDSLGLALTNKIHQSIVKTQRYRRESGLMLSESAGRIVNVSSGRVWTGAVRYDLDTFSSSGQSVFFCYHSSGTWTASAIPSGFQYNNTQYDDGTNLQPLTANRYGVNFIYRGVEEESECYVVLGQGDYKLNEVTAAQPPSSLPQLISSHAILIGRIIVPVGASTAYQIDSAFAVSFTGTGAISHEDLLNLYGGDAGGHYHFTQSEWNDRVGKTYVDSLVAATSGKGGSGDASTALVTAASANAYYQSVNYTNSLVEATSGTAGVIPRTWTTNTHYSSGEIIIYNSREYYATQDFVSDVSMAVDMNTGRWAAFPFMDYVIGTDYSSGAIVKYLDDNLYWLVDFSLHATNFATELANGSWQLIGYNASGVNISIVESASANAYNQSVAYTNSLVEATSGQGGGVTISIVQSASANALTQSIAYTNSVLPSGGNAFVYAQNLIGVNDGVNKVFRTPSTYWPGTTQVYRDGQYMAPNGNDYTETSASSGGYGIITFVTAPVSGSLLIASYQMAGVVAVSGVNAFYYNQVLGGTVNGSNTIFTTPTTYIGGSTLIFRDGQLMEPNGNDYTETSPASGGLGVITFTVAPASGSTLTATYQQAIGTSGNSDTVDGFHAAQSPTNNTIPVLDSIARMPIGTEPALNLYKQVRGASTSSLSSASLVTGLIHDGVTYNNGDRFFNKNHTTDNGIWVIGASPSRANDSDTDSKLRGAKVAIAEGTVNGTKMFTNTNTSVINIGVTNITYQEVGSGVSGGGTALSTTVSTTAFDNILSSSDTDLQKVSEKLDEGAYQNINKIFFVRGATTSAIAVSAMVNGLVHDGVTYSTGETILNKNATVGAENGIYIIGASTGTRWTRYNTDATIRGSQVYVKEGTVNAGMIWCNTNLSAITIDSTTIEYLQSTYQIIQTSRTYTVKTSGGDFTSVNLCLSYLNKFAISGNATVTILIDDGNFQDSSAITVTHRNGDRIKINGTNSYTKTVNSIQSVGAWVADGSFYYREIILKMASITNIATTDYALISDTTGGVYPELIRGCHPVVNVDSGNTRITVRVYGNNQYSQSPSGNVTTSACEIIKTTLQASAATNVVSVYSSLGDISKVVLIGYGENNDGITYYGTSGGFILGKLGTFGCSYGVRVSKYAQVEPSGALFGAKNKAGGIIVSGSLSVASNISHCFNACYSYGIVCVNGYIRMPTSTFVSCGAGADCQQGGLVSISGSVSLLTTNGFSCSSYGGIMAISNSQSFLNAYGYYAASYGNITASSYATKVITGTTSTSNKLITSMTNTNYLSAGMAISGTGIPTGATIASVDSGTQITFSASGNGTANGANSHTYTPAFSPALNVIGNNNSLITG